MFASDSAERAVDKAPHKWGVFCHQQFTVA
jgi:hypothetical protein